MGTPVSEGQATLSWTGLPLKTPAESVQSSYTKRQRPQIGPDRDGGYAEDATLKLNQDTLHFWALVRSKASYVEELQSLVGNI